MRYFLLLLSLHAGLALSAPRVVTSVAPLQELTAALMSGVATPEVLIGNQASAHHFALRPSHMLALQRADLLVWIDRRFEAGLQRISEVLPESTRQLELLPLLDPATDDGHIWYSAPLLLASIELVLAELVILDPGNAAIYTENARRLAAAIQDWRDETVSKLGDQTPRFITDHKFTAHLQTDLGIRPIANLHDQHDDHGGLRELGDIEARLREQPAACLLSLEPDLSPLARELAQKYDLRIIRLGPGGEHPASTPAIVNRLQRLSDALLACT